MTKKIGLISIGNQPFVIKKCILYYNFNFRKINFDYKKTEVAFMGYFEIGKITNVHGIKGTFKVFPTTEEPKRFELLKEVTIDLNGVREVFNIKKIGYHKNMVLMTLHEIDDINEAEKYKNASVLIPDEQALALDEDEYYTRDLYDINVISSEGEELGTITDILVTGANDVYVVSKQGNKDILIPAIKDCVTDVDIVNRTMTVKLLKGLRE